MIRLRVLTCSAKNNKHRAKKGGTVPIICHLCEIKKVEAYCGLDNGPGIDSFFYRYFC